MTKYISKNNPVSVRNLKRHANGAVVRHHNVREDVCFTRVTGGWKRERTDVTSETPKVVSSAAVARECNSAVGCKESWARVY